MNGRNTISPLQGRASQKSLNGYRFIGLFTATHLSLCLLISGFGLIITGLLGVVSNPSGSDKTTFHAVGAALICFGALLVILSVVIFIVAFRWGRKKIYIMDSPQAMPTTIIAVPVVPQTLPTATNQPVISPLTENNNNIAFLKPESLYPLQLAFNPHYPFPRPFSPFVSAPSAPPSQEQN